MGWGANSWLRCTKEETFGVYDTTPAAGDVAWFRLIGGNAFSMRPVPQQVIIRSADGGNRRRQIVAARKVVAGNLSTAFYPTQASFLLNAALTLTSNDLASYTLDFWDTVQVYRNLGCKVGSLGITSTAMQDYLAVNVGWVAQKKDTTTLAQPADTVFPAEVPYEHVESKGHLSIEAATQVKYSSLSLSVKNVLGPTWDEDEWITNLYYCGRDVDFSYKIQYTSTTMRDSFLITNPLTITAAWARAGGLTTTIDMKTNSYISGLTDDLPLDNAAYQSMTLASFFDPAASADVSFTVA